MEYNLEITDKYDQKYIIKSSLTGDQYGDRIYTITEVDNDIKQNSIVILDNMISEVINGLITIERITNQSEKREKENANK